MSTAYTPGPWRVVDGEIHAVDDTHVVCFGHGYDEYGSVEARGYVSNYDSNKEKRYEAEVAANLNLLAAAPDLLAALKDAAEWAYNPFEPDNQSPRYTRMIAVIAKAEGK